VFTEVRGRPAIFWQTQRAARGSNPGGRIPSAGRIGSIAIDIDSRERYPFRFPGKDVATERTALPAGDYGVRLDGEVIAVVERKTLEDLATSLSDGKLAFQLQRLAEFPVAAVAVEGRYSSLLKVQRARGAWLADMLARLQVRYPEVQVVFADSRKFAEDWTYRFLASALADASRSDNTS
jgi:ERCC4-type nuclease